MNTLKTLVVMVALSLVPSAFGRPGNPEATVEETLNASGFAVVCARESSKRGIISTGNQLNYHLSHLAKTTKIRVSAPALSADDGANRVCVTVEKVDAPH